jgi:cytochrome c oxidase assembly factor CtaG
VLRIYCIVVLTVLAIGWLALFATSSDPLILRSLIFVLGITTMAAARSSHFRLQ